MIDSFLQPEIIHALSWTLIHSLWQISVVAILLSVFLKICKHSDAIIKYYMSVGSLLLSIMIAAMTFAFYYDPVHNPTSGLSDNLMSQAQVLTMTESNYKDVINNWLQNYNIVIVYAWIIGSALFFIKFLGGYAYLKSIVRDAIPASDKITDTLKRVNKYYRIHRNIIVKESMKITTPMVVGYLKPVILFPIGLAAQLSVSEVEAILAHELAHIKRHDYIVNMLQIIVESVFYFNPAVWYLSSCIRLEREHCCDDMAIKVTNSSMAYARTLIKLQELNMQNLQPALAMTGNRGEFSQRIRRILGLSYIVASTKDRLILLLLFISAGCIYATEIKDHSEHSDNYDIYVIDDCPQSPENIKFYLDTIPERNFFKIKKKSSKKDIELEVVDGKIFELIINGEHIPKSDYQYHDKIIEQLRPDHKNGIITLFPDCDDQLGKIYYVDKLGDRVVNLDSIVTELKSKTSQFQKFDYSFLDFDANHTLEKVIVDSVENKLKEMNILENPISHYQEIKIDSIDKIIEDKYEPLFGR